MPRNALQLEKKDKQGKLRNCGSIEIRNQTDTTAELYFYGDICSEQWQSEWYPDDQAPADVVEFLNQLDGVETINVHFNSGGGSVFGGIAIANLLKEHTAHCVAYIDSLCASIATVIACSCDVIKIYKNSTFMIHKPSSYAFGNADDMRKEADTLDVCQQSILTTYMTKTKDGVTEEELEKLINDETWFTGEKAAEYFDMEVLGEGTQAAANSMYFDKYKNVPQNIQSKEDVVPVDRIKDLIETVLDERLKPPNDTEKQNIEERKNAILRDLNMI